MPEQPTYSDIKKFADALTDKPKGIYGITLRGRPGWIRPILASSRCPTPEFSLSGSPNSNPSGAWWDRTSLERWPVRCLSNKH